MVLSTTLKFRSDRLEGDVATFLCDELLKLGFSTDYLDEKWGWLVFSVPGQYPIFEIAIYNLAIGQWGLVIRCFEQTKFLRLFRRLREIPVPAAIAQAIDQVLRENGCVPEPWQRAQSGRPT